VCELRDKEQHPPTKVDVEDSDEVVAQDVAVEVRAPDPIAD
jgi:hypothetical protein